MSLPDNVIEGLTITISLEGRTWYGGASGYLSC